MATTSLPVDPFDDRRVLLDLNITLITAIPREEKQSKTESKSMKVLISMPDVFLLSMMISLYRSKKMLLTIPQGGKRISKNGIDCISMMMTTSCTYVSRTQ
jgi:hypothetical protein